jgi:hypothetical protein
MRFEDYLSIYMFNLDSASTFKFFRKGAEKLPNRVHYLNSASPDLINF